MKKKNLLIGLPILFVIILTIILVLIFRTKLSKSDALEKAYQYIGKTEKDFSYRKIERDLGDNSYEIKLNDGEYNYEIEISAKSGTVLDFEKKPISNIPNMPLNPSQNTPNNNNYITKEQAKEIVLNHQNLKEKDVVITKIELDYDNGIAIYEIEYLYNNYEYEYEINATTSEIIKFNKDK